MTLAITDGLSLKHILDLGENEAMYSSLTSNVVSDTVTLLHDQINTKIAQLENSGSQTLVDEIEQLIVQLKQTLDTSVQNDLSAQKVIIESISASGVVYENIPTKTDSTLFNLVATDKMKQIAQLVSEQNADN